MNNDVIMKDFTKDSLEIKLNSCDFADLIKEMQKYEYPQMGNIHHRGGILEHSIWTAKCIESSWDINNENNWIKKLLINNINKKYKNFTILAGFLHDIGKLDGKTTVKDFIKPKHDIHGYNLLTTNSILYTVLDDCIHPKNGARYNKIIAFLAIISKHHLDIGKIMKRELSIENYISNVFSSFSEFPENIYVFRRDDIDLLILILLLVQLCDVIGSRPFDLQSKWKILNKYPLPEEIEEYKKNPKLTPWHRYGYENNGERVVISIQNEYLKQRNLYFNQNNMGIGSNLITEYMLLFNNQDFKIKYSIVPKGVYYFKSMSVGTITQNDHQNFKKVSWFGSESTANIYLENKSFGGFQYQFQTKKELKLIRLDDEQTIFSLFKLLNYFYNTKKDDKYIIMANKLQFAFGVGIKDPKNLKIDKKFTYFPDFNDIKRNSYHTIDLDIMNDIICPLGKENNHNIDGYIANPFFNFHEEIALCRPWEDMKLVKLYKIHSFQEKKTITIGGGKKNNKKDLIIKIKNFHKNYCLKINTMSKKELRKNIKKYSKNINIENLNENSLKTILNRINRNMCKNLYSQSKKDLLNLMKKLNL